MGLMAAHLESWSNYIALGDSFTEGLWDFYPDENGDKPLAPTSGDMSYLNGVVVRGWADRLATGLVTQRAAAGFTGFQYANLAVRGRLLRHVIDEQVPAALEQQPRLVSLIAGGNDLLRPKVDVDDLAAMIDGAVERFQAAGTDVLLSTNVDNRDSPVVNISRGRFATFNMHLWSIARRRGTFMMDLWGQSTVRDWRMWAPDRIHPSEQGHTVVSNAALDALGLETPEDWREPLPGHPPTQPRLRENLHWARSHLYPWATRRFKRRSSGDQRVAKYPMLIDWPQP